MVALATKEGTKQEFTADHAERILRMKNSGWHLPEESDYELKDGIITRRDKGKGRKAEKA